MELEEFKLLWTKNISADQKALIQKNELDSVFLNATTKLTQLTMTSAFWWRVSLSGIILLLFLSIGTGVSYLLFPARLQSLTNALPVMITFASFIILVGWLYYTQARIFEVYDSHSMGSALRHAIDRFTSWYKLSMVAYAIILTPIFYFLAVAFCYKVDVSLTVTMQVSISIILMILTIMINHLHYKRTYFTWLNQLKGSLSELEKHSVNLVK